MTQPTLWLATVPLWASGLLVVAIPTFISMLVPIWLRRSIGLDYLTSNNEVAGFKFAVLGVIYAVLVGFAVIVVWERFHDAETAVAEEAGAVAALYRLSAGVGAEGVPLQDSLGAFVRATIDEEWPALSRGSISLKETRALNTLYAAALATPSQPRELVVLPQILTQLNQLTAARRECVVLAEGVVPDVVWAVLALGAISTVGFTFFFGTRNLSAQVMMTGALAFMIFMGLLVILSINRPFTGQVSVTPEPLKLVLHEFTQGLAGPSSPERR